MCCGQPADAARPILGIGDSIDYRPQESRGKWDECFCCTS